MTSKELILHLLNYPLDWEVEILDGNCSCQITPPVQILSDEEKTISISFADGIKRLSK